MMSACDPKGWLSTRWDEVAHPVRLEPERGLELAARDDVVIVGAVVRGRAVDVAARRFDELQVLAIGDVLRSLEHHVLEEVGEAGAARLLVLRADVIPEIDSDDRGRLVLGEEDGQAVRQRVALDLELRALDRRRLRARRDRGGEREERGRELQRTGGVGLWHAGGRTER
jgi:hypothetical protein